MLDILSVYGHEVGVARNGLEAVELVQSFRPDLIFMDMCMPVMDGLEATRRIRNIPDYNNKVPIIISLTATTGQGAVKDQFAAGCDDHLPKPVESKALFAILTKHLAGPLRSSIREV
jgi:CheY-like chemotaxis protein